MGMKTIEEIKFEIERVKEVKKLNVVNDLITWLQDTVIPMNIHSDRVWIHDYDRKIGEHFEAIKPILEKAGYKVSLVQLKDTETSFFGKDTTYTRNLVEIRWK